MKLRMAALVTSVIIAIFVVAGLVYAHCHNVDSDGNPSCEDNFQIRGLWEWDEDNSSNAVYYKVNWRYKQSMPNLTSDSKEAASQWSHVEYRGETADLQLIFNGETNRLANNLDRENVVSWLPIGREAHYPLAKTYPVHQRASDYTILERDIGFNYYRDWKKHSQAADGFYCIRNAAAHEFGHFVGLHHVGWDPDEDEDGSNCEEYTEYTMFDTMGANEHNKESIECEEKYAMVHKYEPAN